MNIQNIEMIESHWDRLEFFRLTKIYEFLLVRSDEGLRLEIEISTDAEIENFRARFRFDGVQGVKSIGFSESGMRIFGFDIIDIRKDCLEGLNWNVVDFENDDIRFFCKEVEVLSFKKF